MTTMRMINYFFRELTDKAVKESFENASWAGRFETVLDSPRVILDGAHNSNGAIALARALQADKTASRRVFLLGVMSDKDVDEILLKLLPLADRCVFCAPKGERAASSTSLLEKAKELFPQKQACFEASSENVFETLKKLVAEEREAQIVVAGSLYMIGEVKEGLAESKLK